MALYRYIKNDIAIYQKRHREKAQNQAFLQKSKFTIDRAKNLCYNALRGETLAKKRKPTGEKRKENTK
jgi:hypothetical protein